MLAGDLNARTGCVLDLVNTDHCTHIPGAVNLPQQHNVRGRKNYDPQVNEHGKSLLELCKTCDLRIVNGRTTGDTFGRITYHSPKGISTVDYFIVSHEIRGTQRPNLSKDVRSVVNGFLYILEGFLVNLEVP